MRVLSSTYRSRGDAEPMEGLAVRLRTLGAEVRVCAPPDFAELLAHVGVPLVPVGQPVRQLVTGAPPPFDTVAAVAEECDARVSGGLLPSGGWR
jgi:vancomycin aglycone glucosyltransferase